MENSINQRIKEIIKFFNFKSDRQFALKIGIAPTSFSGILNGSEPKYSTLNKILNEFPSISPDWLMTGNGKILKQEKAPINKTHNANVIKYYPSVNGSMGDVNFLDNPNEQSLDIILPNFTNCQYAINAYGDSMSPIIKSGQIVLLQEWNESFIEWGKIYLVITKNGYRTIKYIKHGSDNEHIKCVSANEENEPFEIAYKDVFKMFLVKGWICKDAI